MELFTCTTSETSVPQGTWIYTSFPLLPFRPDPGHRARQMNERSAERNREFQVRSAFEHRILSRNIRGTREYHMVGVSPLAYR